MTSSIDSLPRKVSVKSLVSSRYDSFYKDEVLEFGQRPESWDDRLEGKDVIESDCGDTIDLWSDGGQSPPHNGWVIMLTSVKESGSYAWTLYGIPKEA